MFSAYRYGHCRDGSINTGTKRDNALSTLEENTTGLRPAKTVYFMANSGDAEENAPVFTKLETKAVYDPAWDGRIDIVFLNGVPHSDHAVGDRAHPQGPAGFADSGCVAVAPLQRAAGMKAAVAATSYCSSSNCEIRISRPEKTARSPSLPPTASTYPPSVLSWKFVDKVFQPYPGSDPRRLSTRTAWAFDCACPSRPAWLSPVGRPPCGFPIVRNARSLRRIDAPQDLANFRWSA